MDKTPVYLFSADYAYKHNETDQYRASCDADLSCKRAIESSISEHYSDNRLHSEDAVKQVLNRYGYDRVFHVLAETVRAKDWDGRISRDNKKWAKTIPASEDSHIGHTCVVDQCNPGLTDLFLNQVRHEYATPKALSLDTKLYSAKEEAQRENNKHISLPNDHVHGKEL